MSSFIEHMKKVNGTEQKEEKDNEGIYAKLSKMKESEWKAYAHKKYGYMDLRKKGVEE